MFALNWALFWVQTQTYQCKTKKKIRDENGNENEEENNCRYGWGPYVLVISLVLIFFLRFAIISFCVRFKYNFPFQDYGRIQILPVKRLNYRLCTFKEISVFVWLNENMYEVSQQLHFNRFISVFFLAEKHQKTRNARHTAERVLEWKSNRHWIEQTANNNSNNHLKERKIK